jgi:hypothetical protein
MAERKTSTTSPKRRDAAAYFDEAAVSSCTSTNSTKSKTARRTFTTSQTFLTQKSSKTRETFPRDFPRGQYLRGVSSIHFSRFVEAATEGELSGAGRTPDLPRGLLCPALVTKTTRKNDRTAVDDEDRRVRKLKVSSEFHFGRSCPNGGHASS